MRRSAGKSLSSSPGPWPTRGRGARGESGEGFVCSWKRGGSREAPAGTGAGSRLEEAESHVGWGWAGQVTAASPGMGDGFGAPPFVQLSGHWDLAHAGARGQRGTPTPHGAHGTQVPALGAGGSARLVAQRFLGTDHCPGVTPKDSECHRDSDWCCPILQRSQWKPIPVSRDLTLLQRLGLTLHLGCCGRKKSPGMSTIKDRSCPPCLAKPPEWRRGSPRGAGEMWGHPASATDPLHSVPPLYLCIPPGQ